LKEPDVLHEAGHGLLDAFTSYKQGDITRVLTDGTSLLKMFTRSEETRQQIRQTRTSPADVIQMSGCKNYETSSDTTEAVTFLVRIN
jgi:metacaspase-1